MKQFIIAIFLTLFATSINAESITKDLQGLTDQLANCGAFYTLMTDAHVSAAQTAPSMDIAMEYNFMSDLYHESAVLALTWSLKSGELFLKSPEKSEKYVRGKYDEFYKVVFEKVTSNAVTDKHGRKIIDMKNNAAIDEYGAACVKLIDNPKVMEFFSVEETPI